MLSEGSLDDGQYSLTVYAVDPAGHAESNPRTYEWTIITAPPTLLVHSITPVYTAGDVLELTVSCVNSGIVLPCSRVCYNVQTADDYYDNSVNCQPSPDVAIAVNDTVGIVMVTITGADAAGTDVASSVAKTFYRIVAKPRGEIVVRAERRACLRACLRACIYVDRGEGVASMASTQQPNCVGVAVTFFLVSMDVLS